MNELYGIPAETISAICKVHGRTLEIWKGADAGDSPHDPGR